MLARRRQRGRQAGRHRECPNQVLHQVLRESRPHEAAGCSVTRVRLQHPCHTTSVRQRGKRGRIPLEMSSRLSSRTGCSRGQALTDCAIAANDCRLMSRPLVAHRAIVVVLLALAACGKKGPPLAPLRVAPARVEDLAVAKTGEEVRARFTVPSTNADQTKPADLVAVEVYAISGKPEDPLGNSLGGPQFIRFGELVGRVQVAPPETPGEDAAGPDPRLGRRAGPRRGGDCRPAGPAGPGLVGHRRRAPDAGRLHAVRPSRSAHQAPTPPATTVLVRPLGPAPAEEPFSRTYVAIGVSRHGTQSPFSNRVAVPLADAPGPPSAVTVVHAETSRDDRSGPSRPAPSAACSGRPNRTKSRRARWRRASSPRPIMSTASGARPAAGRRTPPPVNTTPIEGTAFTQSAITLGEEGCYQVRAVRVYGSARLESAPSETACTTFVDTFPPPPPTNLAAVGSEGGVSLIWDPSPGADVAGYRDPPRRDRRRRPAGDARPAHAAADSREHVSRRHGAPGRPLRLCGGRDRRRDTAQSERRIEPGRRRGPVISNQQ